MVVSPPLNSEMQSLPSIEKPIILVTGGTGYIGSHAVVALGAAGYYPVIVDNLSNSKASVLERIAAITGNRPPFYKTDLRDRTALDVVFQEHPVTAVIHFAGLKAVGESVAMPPRYYENNVRALSPFVPSWLPVV